MSLSLFGMSLGLTITFIIGILMFLGITNKVIRVPKHKMVGIGIVVVALLLGGVFSGISTSPQAVASGQIQSYVTESATYLAVDASDDKLIHIRGSNDQIGGFWHNMTINYYRDFATVYACSERASSPDFRHPTDSTDVRSYNIVEKQAGTGHLQVKFDDIRQSSSQGFAEGATTATTVVAIKVHNESVRTLSTHQPKDFTLNMCGQIYTVRVTPTS